MHVDSTGISHFGDRYVAAGYGDFLVRFKRSSIESLNLVPVKDYIYAKDYYSSDVDGIYETRADGDFYYFFNMDKVNSLVKYEFTPMYYLEALVTVHDSQIELPSLVVYTDKVKLNALEDTRLFGRNLLVKSDMLKSFSESFTRVNFLFSYDLTTLNKQTANAIYPIYHANEMLYDVCISKDLYDLGFTDGICIDSIQFKTRELNFL